jgi:hypothetical protein
MNRKSLGYEEAYDAILFSVWDTTTGMGGTKKEIYKAAAVFAEFIISEIKRAERIAAGNEAAAVRRGLIMPKSQMSAWTWNVLDDLHQFGVAPPWELCQVIYHLMGCSHLNGRRESYETRNKALQLLRQGVSVRKAAASVGVNPSSVSRWMREEPRYPAVDIDPALRQKLIKLTRADQFWGKHLRKPVLHSK